MVFERCVPDVHLSCPCHRHHFCRYHHCHRRLGRDLHQYFLVEVAVGCFLLDQLPFLYFVGELMLTLCQSLYLRVVSKGFVAFG